MKKGFAILLAMVLLAATLTACSQGASNEFNAAEKISVIKRESGSGTHGAFIELFGIEVKDESGNKTDTTSKDAATATTTNVMLQNIAQNKQAIGYLSLGSLNDTVKALQIDGVTATTENIKAGTYPSRPFYVATKGAATGLAEDFIKFAMSADGQKIASEEYVTIDDAAPSYVAANMEGKLTITGSTSVYPLVEKLTEAYKALNQNAQIELSQSDSSAGLATAISGTCDIAMSSRDLTEKELADLTPVKIALDGIALVVNLDNPLTNLTKAQIKSIFTAEITTWENVK